MFPAESEIGMTGGFQLMFLRYQELYPSIDI